MELGSSALAFILVTAALAWFWQDSLAARECANSAAQEACRRLRLQFLDGTVAFVRIALRRNYGHRIALRRSYVFDYTTDSMERQQGFVVLMGQVVESVGFAERPAAMPSQASTSSQPPQQLPDNVLRLDDWRRRRRRTAAPSSNGTEDGHR